MLTGDFARGLMLLSRVPWSFPSNVSFQAACIARSVWCWPLIGVLLSGVAVLPALMVAWLTGNGALAALGAIVAMVLLTGSLHEDGIADCADGFGGGTTREKKLAIMRDSRIGSYGVVALALVFAARILLLTQAFDAGIFMTTLLLAAMFSRLAIPVLMIVLRPARPDGLGRGAGRPGMVPFLVALWIVIGGAMILGGAVMMLACLLAVAVACLVVGKTAQWQIGGQSGDVLGSVQIIAEIFVMIAIISVTIRVAG
ncbi:hypothetical protein TMES_00205 [Thalassospira mesophila]|uniref:Adenosylcobinamide-GDP ribazoletransferase n=1 Tax=Thalassospira mesophila TaxID=1293891 RepID=A0A1Y2L7U3_9PROT|nr:hypothetical protein TMES_00205 [Thalassospira mesophila]